jgi:hypothetical protein
MARNDGISRGFSATSKHDVGVRLLANQSTAVWARSCRSGVVAMMQEMSGTAVSNPLRDTPACPAAYGVGSALVSQQETVPAVQCGEEAVTLPRDRGDPDPPKQEEL